MTFFKDPYILTVLVGFTLAFLTNLLMSNAERKPPEFRLRLNNAALAGLTACAICDVLIQNSLFTVRMAPAYCALIGLMADAKIWKLLAAGWLRSFAERHGFEVPDKFKRRSRQDHKNEP